MKYLLDTNVISETIRKSPDAHVTNWFHAIASNQLYVSVLTLGEIRRGIEKSKDEGRKEFLTAWFENDLMNWFCNRIVSISADVSDKWGYITANGTFPAIDSLIAATALTHNMKLVTRNVADFKSFGGLEIVNPWNFCH
jgi:predicted nucleic acid-binding protein